MGLKAGVCETLSPAHLPPVPNIHTRVPSAFPRTTLCPPDTRARPSRLRRPHSPVTRSAPAFREQTLSPQGPRPPSRLPQERGRVPEHNPVPAGPAHTVAGGASSSSQSASRASRPSRVRWRAWAKAPHAASQEEARVGQRLSSPCRISFSIRPPRDHVGSGTSLYNSLICTRPREGERKGQLPARPAANLRAAACPRCLETSYRRHACARRPDLGAGFKSSGPRWGGAQGCSRLGHAR